MYCSTCGKEVPEDDRFCRGCGAPAGPPVSAPRSPPVPPVVGPLPAAPVGQPLAPPVGEPIPAPPVAPPGGPQTLAPPPAPVGGLAGGAEGLGGPGAPVGPGGKGRRGLWIALAAVAVVVIAAAITVPLVLARGGDNKVTTTATSTAPSTSTTTTESASTTEPETSSTSTSVTTEAGVPGDSAGEWVETDIPGAPGQIMTVSISDEVLLMDVQTDAGLRLYAYRFLSGTMDELPVAVAEVGGRFDVDGFTATWWEGTYDEASSSYTDQHIYAYDVYKGEKTEVAGGGRNVGYPQTNGALVTWTERSRWDPNPEEYTLLSIYGVLPSLGDEPVYKPVELVPSAVAPIMGDATWTYSLGKTFLAWEQGAAVGSLDTGTYVLDLTNLSAAPRSIGTDAWRPSLSLDSLLYWENGLQFLDLKTGEEREIDPKGDFPTAAPTFVAYFRSIESGDGGAYEIVARGLSGGYEQVLSQQQADPPWLSPVIAASGTRVAFVAAGTLHVFEWKGQ